MSTRVYKDSCADYYAKAPSQMEYKKQINCLASSSLLKFTCLDEKKGIKLVGILEKIWQIIKGFFGFTNYTNPVLIKSEALKLLHYGKSNSFLENKEILKSLENFKAVIDSKQTKAGKSVSSLVRDICDSSKTLSITDFQEKLATYHQKHEEDLKPGFWQRLFVSPQIIKTTLLPFGASHLQLAKQAEKASLPHANDEHDIAIVEQKIQAREEVLKQYCYALAFDNNKLEEKVRVQFRKFLETSWPKGKATDTWNLVPQEQQEQILHIMRKLSSVEHQSNDESKISEEYASFGLRYFSDPSLQATKYIAQVKQKNYREAYQDIKLLEMYAETLELSLKCLDSDDKREKKNYLTELKKTYEAIGELHSQYNNGWIIDTRNHSHASAYFHKAWQKDPSDVNLEIKLFRCLMSAAEKGTWWGYFKSWFGLPNQEGKEFVTQACEYISSIKLEDFQRLIDQFEKQKHYDKAIYFYEFGVKKLSDSSSLKISTDSYYQVGLSKRRLKNDVDGYENFKKAVEIDPDHAPYKRALFDCAKQMGKNYQDDEPLLARHYYYQALQCHLLEDEKEEMQDLISSLCLSFAQVFVNSCLVPLMDYPSFSEEWKKHKKTHKNTLNKALKWYDEAIQNDPKNGMLHFEKAELLNYFEMKNEDCQKEYEQAVKCNPDNYFYLLRLSEIYNERHDDKNAVKYRELALKIRKGAALHYLHWYDDRFLRDKIYNIDPHTS